LSSLRRLLTEQEFMRLALTTVSFSKIFLFLSLGYGACFEIASLTLVMTGEESHLFRKIYLLCHDYKQRMLGKYKECVNSGLRKKRGD